MLILITAGLWVGGDLLFCCALPRGFESCVSSLEESVLVKPPFAPDSHPPTPLLHSILCVGRLASSDCITWVFWLVGFWFELIDLRFYRRSEKIIKESLAVYSPFPPSAEPL